MRQIIAFLCALACTLGLPNNAGQPEPDTLITLREINTFVSEKGYICEEFQEKLSGIPYEKIHAAWGEPDGMLSGFWGDIWQLDSENSLWLILYYDADGTVEAVKITEP